MTTTVETEAAHIVTLSRREEQQAGQLQYLAGAIASAAADGDTESDLFVSYVNQYKTLRNEHSATKAAYNRVLNG